MIHVFNFCSDACTMPHKICEKCSEACENSPCAICCQRLSEKVNELINRPLGGFVFMAVWVAVLELACCGYAIYNQDLLVNCQFRTPMFGLGIHHWLSLQLGFSALNLVFAPYLQTQVWRTLIFEAKERDNPSGPISDRTLQANTEQGPIRASKQDVAEAFKQVFMYDIGVCLYFFVLCASFYTSWYGDGQILADRQNCDYAAEGFPRYSSLTGMFFVVFVFIYGMAWLCNLWCMDQADTLTLRKGLTMAAGASAAAGKPVPGFPAQGPAAYYPPQQAAMRTDHAGGGLFGGQRMGTQPLGLDPRQQQQQRLDAEMRQQSKPSCGKTFMKLLASIGLDMLGNATYFVPGVGEMGDVVFAPASAVMLKMMYNANGVALLGLVEELLPFTDIIPTATIAWFLQTCAPSSPITRALGINSEWEMTGRYQK